MRKTIESTFEQFQGDLSQVVNVETLCRGTVQEIADGEGDVEDALEGRVHRERLEAELEVSKRLADLLLQNLKVHLESPKTEARFQPSDRREGQEELLCCPQRKLRVQLLKSMIMWNCVNDDNDHIKFIPGPPQS